MKCAILTALHRTCCTHFHMSHGYNQEWETPPQSVLLLISISFQMEAARMPQICTLLSSAAEQIGIQWGCVSACHPVFFFFFLKPSGSLLSHPHILLIAAFLGCFIPVCLCLCVLITQLLCFFTVQMEYIELWGSELSSGCSSQSSPLKEQVLQIICVCHMKQKMVPGDGTSSLVRSFHKHNLEYSLIFRPMTDCLFTAAPLSVLLPSLWGEKIPSGWTWELISNEK